MKIQIGEVYMDKVSNKPILYPNKTRRYLLPCLKEYGEDFMGRLNNVFKVAAGIGDVIVQNRGIVHEKHVFILLDSVVAPAYFISFILWIREQPMFEDDYAYGDIQNSTYHMVVLKFPEQYYETFHIFKEGNYSQMFNKETLSKFFENYPTVKKVLIKDHNYRIHFVGRLNKRFLSNVKPEDWNGELDFKPTEEGEVFNHHIKH